MFSRLGGDHIPRGKIDLLLLSLAWGSRMHENSLGIGQYETVQDNGEAGRCMLTVVEIAHHHIEDKQLFPGSMTYLCSQHVFICLI